MKSRSTLLLFLIATGLAAYIVLVESQRPSTKEAAERSKHVLQIDRDKLDSITLKNTDAKIELRKKDNTWFVEEPVKDRADSIVLAQLFTSLEILRHDAALGSDGNSPDPAALKEFGVASSETWIKLNGPGLKPVELILGKDAAVGGKLYAKLASSPTVYVVGNDLKNQISKKPDDFRDHRLSSLSAEEIHRTVFKTKAGEIELEKKAGLWSLTKPLRARGDASRIKDFISKATTTRIESFVSDSAAIASAGLQEPRATISFFTEGSKEPVLLQIGSNPADSKEKEKTYAKLSTRDCVVLLPKSIEQLLDTQPNDLRDRSLVRFERDIVDRIHLEKPGTPKLTLARKAEGWVRKSEKDDLPVNSSAANALLDSLSAELARNFVADNGSDLPKYGLDKPSLKLTLSSFASENTSETAAGDKPIATLLFGKSEDDHTYAKLDEEPFIVSVDTAFLDRFSTEPSLWQPLEIFSLQPADITSIEVTPANHPTVSFHREKDQWSLAKGQGKPDQKNIGSLLKTLTRLRAVKWVDPATHANAIKSLQSNPAIVLRFKTTSGTEATLRLATPSETNPLLGSSSTTLGVFELSLADRVVFDQSLLEQPAPSSTTPPPATTPPPPAANAQP